MHHSTRISIQVPLTPFSSTRAGFTLFEVVVALILLTAGVGAFLGTALLTTRLVADGRATTRAKQAASERLELLRGITQAAPLYCAGLSDGTDSTPDGLRVAWQIRPLGQLAEVTVIVAPDARPVRGVDSLTALFRCP